MMLPVTMHWVGAREGTHVVIRMLFEYHLLRYLELIVFCLDYTYNYKLGANK